jgi:hypothetical protein
MIEISKDDFEELCKQHNTEIDIADSFDVSPITIRRWCKRTYGKTFENVYKGFQGRGRCSLRKLLWEAAERGNTAVLIFLAKNELGMSDKNPDTSYDVALNKLDQIMDGIDKQATSKVRREGSTDGA